MKAILHLLIPALVIALGVQNSVIYSGSEGKLSAQIQFAAGEHLLIVQFAEPAVDGSDFDGEIRESDALYKPTGGWMGGYPILQKTAARKAQKTYKFVVLPSRNTDTISQKDTNTRDLSDSTSDTTDVRTDTNDVNADDTTQTEDPERIQLALLEKQKQEKLLQEMREAQERERIRRAEEERLAQEKARIEREQREKEEAEALRLAEEARLKAEEERLAREKAEQARLEEERRIRLESLVGVCKAKKKIADETGIPLPATPQTYAYDEDGDGKEDIWITCNQAGRTVEEKFLINTNTGAAIYTAKYDLISDNPKCIASVTGDRNNDGKPDLWREYDDCYERFRKIDNNFDGQSDELLTFNRSYQNLDFCLSLRERDLNFNGKNDYLEKFDKCEPVREEWDQNENGVKEIIRNLKKNDTWIRRIGHDAMLRAEVYYNEKKLKEAEEWYNKAIGEFRQEWGTSDVRINELVSQCYIRVGAIYFTKNKAEARRNFVSAYESGGALQKATAAGNLGNLAFNEENYRDAAAWYRKALESRFEDEDNLQHYVEAVFFGGLDTSEALTYLTSRIEKLKSENREKPSSLAAQNYYLRGVIYNETRRFPEASADLKRASELSDKNADIWSNYAMAEFNNRRVDSAIEKGNKALTLKNDDLGVNWNLGMFYYVKGDKATARKYFDTAMRMDRNTIESLLPSELEKVKALYPDIDIRNMEAAVKGQPEAVDGPGTYKRLY